MVRFSHIIALPKRIIVLLAIAVLGIGGTGLVQALATATTNQPGLVSLTSAIDTILADDRLEGAQAGVVVRDAEDGSVLYSRNATGLLIPASNNKLYSSSAAMEVLGPDYRFTTTVAADGRQVGGMVTGNLYLKGTGDPTMQAADYDALAAAVVAKGIRQVMGKLIVDDTFFDSRQLGYNWGWDSNPYYYQPEISALTVAADSKLNTGALTVVVSPSTAGSLAKVQTAPATKYVTIQNEATTGPVGSANTLSIERKLGINTIVVRGSIPVGSEPYQDISTVTDPSWYAASLFRDALNRHGVGVLKETSRGQVPANAQLVHDRQSVPLSELIVPYIKLSNNGIAEILVKAMGQKTAQDGSWAAGLGTEIETLQHTLGVDTNKLQFVDGSGLSNVNFTSPQRTTDLLLAAQHKSWFPAWYNALPVAGQSDPLVGGTLASRMKGTPAAGNVHAKTGSLDNVSALSGYVTDADGKRLVFSIMFNNFIYGSAKPLEDAIAVTLAGFSRTKPVQTQQLRLDTLRKAPVKDAGLECSWTREGC